MKLFKSKKKGGEKKGIFGSRKKGDTPSSPVQKSNLSALDADSGSVTSQTETAWLSSNASGNNQSHSLAHHEQALGGGDRSQTDPIAFGAETVGSGTVSAKAGHKTSTNPFDSSDAFDANASASLSAGSEGSDIGEMESSAGVLKNMLAQITEKEHKEWADGVGEDSQKSLGNETDGDLDEMLRKAVDRMDVEPQDVEVQRLGARIVYHLSKLRHKTMADSRDKAGNSWYASERINSDSGRDDEEEEELITDALEAILQAMEDYPDDEILIEDACLALEATSETRNINNSAKRILEEILMAIEGFADNPVVVSASLGLLCNLSSSTSANAVSVGNNENPNGELRRRLAKYALPSILQGMKEHRDDPELYTKGCKAMANFTRDDPNAQRILACKEALGLRIISEGLKYWEVDNLDEFAVLQNLRLRASAIKVLKNLSTHSSLEVKGKIALGGGAARVVDRLLEALVFTGKDLIDNNYHVGELNTDEGDQADEDDEVGISLNVMRDALQTIENLANIESVVTKDDPRSPHMPKIHRSSAIDNSSAESIQKQLTKAVKPVLNTMRQHPNRRILQYHGLSCIRQLTISHADSIANYGGISTFLNILSSSGVAAINDSMIHERSLACLTGLLSPSSNADGLDLVASMETEDGLDAIFRTIRLYQSNSEVIETAYESLFYLSCRVRVVLASIVGRHPSIASGVGAKAAIKLQNQLCLEENVFVMLGTLNQYFQTNELIGQRGLGLLVNVHAFLTQEDQQEQHQSDMLASNGGIRLVLAVMRRHGLAVAVQEYGVGLLAGILKSAICSDTIRREFVDEEGISTTLSAMMIHPDHAAVQSHGCNILIQLIAINKHPMEDGYSGAASISAHYKKLILEETNAVMVVEDSIQRFRSNRGVQHFGSTLLQELSTPTTINPLAKAASISTAFQSSILTSTSKLSSSLRSPRK